MTTEQLTKSIIVHVRELDCQLSRDALAILMFGDPYQFPTIKPTIQERRRISRCINRANENPERYGAMGLIFYSGSRADKKPVLGEKS